MQNITTLRYWCHKVIPLVYDDSLSYYELLGKVVGKLNEVIENTNEIPEYIKDTVLDMLKDSEAIEAILEEYLNDNNVELKSDLKSGTMPIEYMYQQTFSNSNYANAPSGASYYEVMQSMCFNNGLIYTCAYDRPEGINGRMSPGEGNGNPLQYSCL